MPPAAGGDRRAALGQRMLPRAKAWHPAFAAAWEGRRAERSVVVLILERQLRVGVEPACARRQQVRPASAIRRGGLRWVGQTAGHRDDAEQAAGHFMQNQAAFLYGI